MHQICLKEVWIVQFGSSEDMRYSFAFRSLQERTFKHEFSFALVVELCKTAADFEDEGFVTMTLAPLTMQCEYDDRDWGNFHLSADDSCETVEIYPSVIPPKPRGQKETKRSALKKKMDEVDVALGGLVTSREFAKQIYKFKVDLESKLSSVGDQQLPSDAGCGGEGSSDGDAIASDDAGFHSDWEASVNGPPIADDVDVIGGDVTPIAGDATPIAGDDGDATPIAGDATPIAGDATLIAGYCSESPQ